jgi:hypothetical protein
MKSPRRKSVATTKKNKSDLIGWFFGKRKQTAKSLGVSSWFSQNTRKEPSNLVNSGLNAILFGDKRSSNASSRKEMAKALELQRYYDARKTRSSDQPLSSREMAKALELQKYYDARKTRFSDQPLSRREMAKALELQKYYDRRGRKDSFQLSPNSRDEALQLQRSFDDARGADDGRFLEDRLLKTYLRSRRRSGY